MTSTAKNTTPSKSKRIKAYKGDLIYSFASRKKKEKIRNSIIINTDAHGSTHYLSYFEIHLRGLRTLRSLEH